MTELLNQEESTERKLEGEELANAARELRNKFSIYHEEEILENVVIGFESGGITGSIRNSVDGDQHKIHVDVGGGEYVDIMTALGPSGINSVRYTIHGKELTDIADSERAVREAQEVAARISPKSRGQPTGS